MRSTINSKSRQSVSFQGNTNTSWTIANALNGYLRGKQDPIKDIRMAAWAAKELQKLSNGSRIRIGTAHSPMQFVKHGSKWFEVSIGTIDAAPMDDLGMAFMMLDGGKGSGNWGHRVDQCQ